LNFQTTYTDDNNATFWKAATNRFPQQLTIDLGELKNIKRVSTQFEFASYYYQYKLEYSDNGKKWAMYVDKSQNRTSGSPMFDDKEVSARYLKLTILGAEKTGILAAIWNIKVYDSLFNIPLNLHNKPSAEGPAIASSKKLLIDLNPDKIPTSSPLVTLPNRGSIGGIFTKSGEVGIEKDQETGIKAIAFSKGALTLEKVPVPRSLAWNGAYTVATLV